MTGSEYLQWSQCPLDWEICCYSLRNFTTKEQLSISPAVSYDVQSTKHRYPLHLLSRCLTLSFSHINTFSDLSKAA